MAVLSGIEVLRKQQFAPLTDRRVGMLTNPSAVASHLKASYRVLWEAPQVNLVALFSPEHGFAAAVPDGVLVGSTRDAWTGLPVHSLYGDSLKPTEAMIREIDLLVCDIQDIGVRYYTYLWTLSYVLEAAAEYGVEICVLDRPNPLGGTQISGSPLEPEFSSIVGRYPIPVQHGMTLGELAEMINTLWNPKPAKLTVIACEGWGRSQGWDDLGLPWVPPSPNMPHFITALHYPGACLLEGTNLSEGRGTPLPFEITGAPWIDAIALADHLNALNLGGVVFRPHSFTPAASKYSGELCHGIQAHIIERDAWQPITTWLHVIATIRTLYPDHFRFLDPYQPGRPRHFDLLAGSDQLRAQLERGDTVESIISTWGQFCDQFAQQRASFLRYP